MCKMILGNVSLQACQVHFVVLVVNEYILPVHLVVNKIHFVVNESKTP